MKKGERQDLLKNLVTQEENYYTERILDLGYDFELYCHIKGAAMALRTDDAAVIQLVKKKCTYLLRKTLEAGGNPNATDERGKSALSYALENKRNAQGCAARLIRHGAVFEPELLTTCVKNKWHELLEAVLETGTNLNITDADGNTALHYAARKGFCRIIKMLIKAGAGIDIFNKAGMTPLMLAIRNRRFEATATLLKYGANINLKGGKHHESIHALCLRIRCELKNDYTMQRLPWDDTARQDLPAYRFYCAAKENNEAKIIRLIQEGEDINVFDHGGYTALHWCADVNEGEVELLVKHGADIYAEIDEDISTPAALAADFESTRIFTKLLDCGYDVNHIDARGTTLLMRCAAAENVWGCRLLSERGANPSIKDKEGETALFYASGYNLVCYDENIDMLLEHGADINATNNAGNTALINIADQELDGDETHLALITRGIDVNIRNHAGQTALSIAKQHGHKRLISTLLAAGARDDV